MKKIKYNLFQQLSAHLLSSPFGYGSGVCEVGISQCQMLCMMSSPRQSAQNYKESTVCGCLLWAWLHLGWARFHCKTGFYNVGLRGVSANVQRHQ